MVVQPQPQLLVKRRVLYIGSSVPLETQEGIEAIQQPLRDRYPSGDETQVQGIDAYVSILSTGIQLQYIEDGNLVIFFPITSLTLCAAVRHVKNINAGTGEVQSQFLSLSNPLTKAGKNSKSPAIFSTITRRTKGRKILECHGFLCASDQDAMDLVRATSVVDRKSRGLPPLAPQPVPAEPQQTFRGPPEPQQTFRGTSFRSAGPPPTFRSANGTLNGHGTARTANGTTNGTANGHSTLNGIRLAPGTVNRPRDAPPEFYEPPPTQGYFYSSEKAEAKTFNIEKNDADEPPSPPMSDREPTTANGPTFTQPPQTPGPGPAPKPMYMMAGQPPPASPTAVPPPPSQPAPTPPQAKQQVPQPAPQPMPSMRRPIYIHPGVQPMPHPYLRHRFFSPPPRMRPVPGPFAVPPPPPGMVPYPPHMMPPRPVFVRRPRKPRSLSSSSRSNSRSPSPQKGDANLRNGGDFGSESSISNYRPRTPPRDYDNPRPRMSRREEYERKRDRSRYSRGPVENGSAYYVYNYPGYQPFPLRSSSVPPHLRYVNTGKKSKKGKKNKKSKKNKKGPASHFSMQSYGYASEIPRGNTYQGWEGFDNPEPVRKPRDFRREENQFMNEKNFSKSIKEETRQSEVRDYPTAYDLNEPAPRPPTVNGDEKEDDIGDFTMY